MRLLLLVALASVSCGPHCRTVPSSWTYYDGGGRVVAVRPTTFVVCHP